MQSENSISIWFFIGISLLVDGVLICGAGLYEYAHPPLHPLVLANLHAGVWWGGILALIGALYCYKFAPSRGKSAI
jgi:hypothetical protein